MVPDEKKPFTKQFDPSKKNLFYVSDYLTLETKKLYAGSASSTIRS